MFGKSESLWVARKQDYYTLQSQGSWREDMASILNIYWWESVNYMSGTADVNYVNWGEEDKVKPTQSSLAPTSAIHLTCRKWSDFTRDLPASQAAAGDPLRAGGLCGVAMSRPGNFRSISCMECSRGPGFLRYVGLWSHPVFTKVFTNKKRASRIWHIDNFSPRFSAQTSCLLAKYIWPHWEQRMGIQLKVN